MTEIDWKVFGKWFQSEREKTGVSQVLAADKADIHQVQLSRIENGHSGAKRETVIQLVEAINKHSTTGYKINLEEALRRSGFSLTSEVQGKPQNIAEFIERLNEIGFSFGGFDKEKLVLLTPDDFQDLLDDIEAKIMFKTSKL